MGGFVPETRDVVAGNTLINEAVQSQNYSSGISGWQIAASGSAEFNNVTVRGVLTTTGDNNSYIQTDNSGGNVELSLYPGDPGGTYTTIDGNILASQVVSPSGFAQLSLQSPLIENGPVPDVAILSLCSQTVDLSTPAVASFSCDVTASGKVTSTKPYLIATFTNSSLANNNNANSGGTNTILSISSAQKNDGPMWSSGSSVTIPAGGGGPYEIGVNLDFASNATGMRQARVVINGTTYKAWNFPAISGFETHASGVIKTVLAAGDVIQFGGFQNSGGALSLISFNECWVKYDGA